MKNLLLVLMSSVLANLSFSNPSGLPTSCPSDLRRLTSTRIGQHRDPHEADFEEVNALLTAKNQISLFSPLRFFIRDPIRRSLRYLHNHPYTVLGINEAPYASLWARYSLGLLSPEELKKIEGDELKNLKERLQKLLTIAFAYPKDVDALSLEAANIHLASVHMALAKKNNTVRDSGIEAKVPQLFWDSKTGQLRLEEVDRYWGGGIALKIEKKELDGFFNFKSRYRTLRREARDRSFEQALSLKNLEIYFHEFKRLSAGLASNHPGFESEQFKEAKAIIEQISSLFQSTITLTVKEDYRPAARSIHQLKWKEFWFELSSIYFKDIPHLVEKSKVKEILEKIKAMPEEEKRALNLDKVAIRLNHFSRSKWIPILVSGGGLGYAIPWMKIFEAAYDSWYSEEIARQECTIQETEKGYLDCAYEFLKNKFPSKLLLFDKDLSKLLTSEGEVADPEIREEIALLKKMRLEYIRELNLAKSLEEPIKIALGEGDKTSETFREKLITTTDEAWLKMALLGSETEVGYLEMRYLLAMKNEAIRKLVEVALQAPTEDERNQSLENLANISLARMMAEDLRLLYKRRKSYQETGYYFPDSYSWRRPLIEKTEEK